MDTLQEIVGANGTVRSHLVRAGVSLDGDDPHACYQSGRVWQGPASISVMPETDLIVAMIALGRLKKELAETERVRKEAWDALEKELVRRWTDDGKVQDKRAGATVSIRRELWPKYRDGVDAHAVTEALKSDADTEYLVKETANLQSLRSFLLNEENCPLNEEGLPEWPDHLRDVLTVSEQFGIRVTG